MLSKKEESLDEENINNISTSSLNTSSLTPKFKIEPNELAEIMNLYKERTEDYEDIRYFDDHGGIEELLNKLETNKKTGILTIENREEHFGSNKIFEKSLPSLLDFIKESLEDKMIIILIISSIIEIGISLFNIFIKGEKNNMDWLDGISIIIAVIVVVIVGSITNYKKEMKFHDLNDLENHFTKFNVIRDSKIEIVNSDDILVGDLIKLNYGEILPADILLIEGNNIKVDESSLTGESIPVKKKIYEECKKELENNIKNISSNLLLCGTNIIEGNGYGIVIAIGDYSQKGIIKGAIDNGQEDNKSPLEIKLNNIADIIGYFGLGAAIITFIASIIQLIYEYIKTYSMTFNEIFNKILRIIILCVSIIVVAIPEGLPLAVTLSLAFSIKKLMDMNNLVRKMHACETMGGANYLCTDKTGTLTKNEIYVISIITNDNIININNNIDNNNNDNLNIKNNNNNNKKYNYIDIIKNENYWNILNISIGLNVDCIIKNIDNNNEIYETKNKTDKAFIEFLHQYNISINNIKNKYIIDNNYKKLPFDSEKKRMSIMIKNNNFPTGYRLFTKGGAENIILYCTKYINKNTNEILNLDDNTKNYINNEIINMNKKCIRSLYICYKDITEEEYNIGFENKNIDKENLIFISIFCLRDILRPEVKNAVNKCHEANVNVIMITGDNIITATSIAKECNIIPENINIDNNIEKYPNEINNPLKKNEYIKNILNNKPYAITGNTFYNIIEGIYCETCGKDTLLCKCPKTEEESKQLYKKLKKKLPIKKDSIKNIENFKIIIENLLVIARSQPLHKYALVLGLKNLNNVVAVTGDGSNDAPALSKSDVGFSMVNGTDIARDSSDIVILDNNFASIIIAIIYGRNIYENIRKFLQFQLTVNFCACILVFICSCIGNETPLTSIQMLWVNLIMDSLGSLALATEPPYNELLKKKPTKKNESIINGIMWKHIILQSLFELILLLFIYIYGPKFLIEYKQNILNSHKELYNCFGILPGYIDYNKYKYNILYGTENDWPTDYYININFTKNNNYCLKYLPINQNEWEYFSLYDSFDYYNSQYGSSTHMTYIFNIFVFYTLFNQINCRIIDDSKNILKRINKSLMFCLVTLSEMLIQIIIIQFGNSVFHCVVGGLSWKQWIICLLFSMSTFIINFIIKFIPLQNFIDKYLNKFNTEEKEEINEIEKINEIEEDHLITDDKLDDLLIEDKEKC